MKKLNTICEECVFLDENKKCVAGRIERYIELGVPVYQSPRGIVIEGRICQFCRNKNSDWTKENEGKNLLELVKDESAVNIKVVIPIKKLKTEMFESVMNTIIEIEKQSYKAKEISIVVSMDNTKSDLRLLKYLEGKLDKELISKINTHAILSKKPGIWELLDGEVSSDKKRESNMVVVVENGKTLPDGYFDKINHLEVDMIENICWGDPLYGSDFHGLVFDSNVREATERGDTRGKVFDEGLKVNNIMER